VSGSPGRPLEVDEAEVIALYRATIRPLYGFVSRRVGGDRGLAEDVVQETWMRAVVAWRTQGLPREPLAWLTLVARNLLVSYYRRRRPEPVDPAALDLVAPAWTPDSPDEAAVVACGLARLPRRHADLLEAFYFDGKSVREIATERATSERAIEGRLRRARARLKTQIDRLTTRPVAVAAD
jgi:RNA polymerase sigma-70 factor (ECF subfamily)